MHPLEVRDSDFVEYKRAIFFYLPSILETQPLETWSILEISQGRAPL